MEENTYLDNTLYLPIQDEEMYIEAVDGKETIADARDIFAFPLINQTSILSMSVSGNPSERLSVMPYEVLGEQKFEEMFLNLSSDFERLILGQAQIANFCRRYLTWIKNRNTPTVFLTPIERTYAMVFVERLNTAWDSDEVYYSTAQENLLLLDMAMFPHGPYCKRGARDRDRFVVPNLKNLPILP